MAVGLLVRRLGQLHEDPAVVARWQAWLGPALAWLTPRRRRSLLALGALYVAVRQPLREMAPAVRLSDPDGPAAAALVVLGCFVAVVAVYAAASRFAGLPTAVRPAPVGDPVPVPDSVRQAQFPNTVTVDKLGNGVYVLGGGPANSYMVEFDQFVAVFEAPGSEERSLAVIEQIVKLAPGKPIRWLINSHQHFDHTGGLRAYNHIGATVVTHWKNYDFLNRDVINYVPRTLRPDMVSLWPPTELAEGYYFETVRENYVITDGTRTMHMHYVNPLQHVEGMLMAYLPRERMLLQADLVNTVDPLPTTISGDQRSFLNAVRKLKLDVGQLVPMHGRPIPWATFEAAARGTN